MNVLITGYVILIITYLIMIPSATASWWSHCFKLSFFQGVGIAISPIVAGIIINSLKADGSCQGGALYCPREHTDASYAAEAIYTFAMASLLAYGIYKQVRGRCKLGYR